uniref:Uncharacterized protein n=1 Tax=Megaselia scalaris TaxID=36166 RepID=T1GTR8_MEGSC
MELQGHLFYPKLITAEEPHHSRVSCKTSLTMGDDKDIDAEIEDDLLEGNEYQLVLPNGNVIGHRSLNRNR